MKNQIPKHLCIALYFNIHLPRYKNLFKLTHIHIKKDEKLIFSYICFFLLFFLHYFMDYGRFFKIVLEPVSDYNCRIVKTCLWYNKVELINR